MAVSFLMTLIFWIGTYYEDHLDKNLAPVWIGYVEIILMILIVADYLLFFFISDNKVFYIFSLNEGIVIYLSIIPTALVRFKFIIDPAVIDNYFLNFWKVFKLFSIFRFIKVFTRSNMPIQRVYFRFIFLILVMIFIFAGAMLTFENLAIFDAKRAIAAELDKCTEVKTEAQCKEEFDADDYLSADHYNYHDMLYYAFVTMTTVGYGDICPTTMMSRYLFICFALCMILVIPSYFQDLTKVNSLTSEYGRIVYTKASKET